jgi:hypothetical protein
MRQFPSFFIGKLALFSCLIIVCFGSSEAQTINNLDPPSIPAGYPFPTLTLEVNGSGFAIGSVVDWNGSPLATTFVTATQLTASVPRTLYQSPGTASVTVQTGATISNGATFTIGPPVPTVTSTTPAYAIAGGPGFTLTINGTGFVPGSTADFLSPVATSVAQPVTFVSATQVTLFVPASQIASPGSYELVVYYPQYTNPSTLYPFTVYPAGVNISSLSPSALAAGFPFPTLQMTVNGSGFANGAMVEWNGSPLPTTFVSFTQRFRRRNIERREIHHRSSPPHRHIHRPSFSQCGRSGLHAHNQRDRIRPAIECAVRLQRRDNPEQYIRKRHTIDGLRSRQPDCLPGAVLFRRQQSSK